MKIEINRWDNQEIIVCGEYESVKDCLEGNKDKSFYRANLRSADLRSADLSSANLRSADLSSADLSLADLRSANLRSAKNINKYLTTPLYTMLEQTGKIRAYKLVNKDNVGPFNGGIVYKVGKKYEEKEADTDETKDCSKGLHLATLDWCLREWREGYKILIAEFTKEDIACIPIGSDGKFRVYRFEVVGEKELKDVGICGKGGEKE